MSKSLFDEIADHLSAGTPGGNRILLANGYDLTVIDTILGQLHFTTAGGITLRTAADIQQHLRGDHTGFYRLLPAYHPTLPEAGSATGNVDLEFYLLSIHSNEDTGILKAKFRTIASWRTALQERSQANGEGGEIVCLPSVLLMECLLFLRCRPTILQPIGNNTFFQLSTRRRIASMGLAWRARPSA
jgi:hypothetical protein